jgi:hypothetical protein
LDAERKTYQHWHLDAPAMAFASQSPPIAVPVRYQGGQKGFAPGVSWYRTPMEANGFLHYLQRLMRLTCPRCGSSSRFCRTPRRNFWERAISALVLPFRCDRCDRRFFRVTPPAALIRGLRERTGRLALLAAVCCLAALLFFGGVPVGVGLWQPMRRNPNGEGVPAPAAEHASCRAGGDCRARASAGTSGRSRTPA